MPSPACVLSPILCPVGSAVGSAVNSAAASAFDGVAQKFAEGLADVMKALMTFWINTPEPDLSSSSGVISTLDGLTRPLVAFAAVLGLVVGGVRMAWTARAEQSGQVILRGLLLMTVVTGAGATIVEVLLAGFDVLAKSVLDNGFDGRPVGERLAALGALPQALGKCGSCAHPRKRCSFRDFIRCLPRASPRRDRSADISAGPLQVAGSRCRLRWTRCHSVHVHRRDGFRPASGG
jgi:hypothetical protein